MQQRMRGFEGVSLGGESEQLRLLPALEFDWRAGSLLKKPWVPLGLVH